MIKCEAIDCHVSKRLCKGYCPKHYRHMRTYGKILTHTLRTINEVVDCGKYVELILTDTYTKEVGRAKIDKEDLLRVQSIGRWALRKDGYVSNTRSKLLLHRFVMDAKENEEVDHKNTGIEFRSDNRKKKLRKATVTENHYNSKVRVDNKSGYKGVYFHAKNKNWIARIQKHGKSMFLGAFETPEKAYKAYLAAASNIQGRFMHKSLKTEIE